MESRKRAEGVGLLVVLTVLLFPRWTWTERYSDVLENDSAYSFIFHPPTAEARIDTTLWGWWLMSIGLTAFGYRWIIREQIKSKLAAQYWQEKWKDDTNTQMETLLRASHEPMQAQEVILLRAAIGGQKVPLEQLMRAVNEQE